MKCLRKVPAIASCLREKRAVIGLASLLLGFRLIFSLALAAMAIAVAAEIASAFILRAIVDGALTKTSQGLGWFIAAALAVGLIAIGRGVFSFLSARGTARVSEGIAKAIREALFDQFQRLPFKYHDRMPTGELIQRATSDIDAVRRFYGELVPNIARISFLFGLNFVAIALLNFRLALLSSLIAPVLIMVSVVFFNKIFKVYDAYQTSDAEASAVLQENISGVRVVKAFARGAYEIDKYEVVNSTRYRHGRHLTFLHALYWPVSHSFCAIQTLAGWFYAANMAATNTISLGTFVAYTGMLGGLIWPLQNLGRMVSQLSTSAVSYGRLSEVIREEPELVGDEVTSNIQLEPTRLSGHIVFEDVWFTYNNSENPLWVLKGISFEAKPGQRIALLGAPGSGKTSLVNLLPRFYEPSKGRILLDGRPLETYPRARLRELIGVVEQQPFLFSMTIADNIKYGSKQAVSQVDLLQAASAAAIHSSITAFPEGYDTMVGERGVTLSGGQKQRLAIARTLLKNPSVLILDDSTSAVDAETEDEIRAAFNSYGKRTSFIVAHKVRSLMDADLILVFKNGEIIERGTHATLMAAKGFYARAFELQTSIEDELTEELRDECRTS